jgi:hypothetical protein
MGQRLGFHGQLSGLAEMGTFQALVRQATVKDWNVYVKLPFAGPEQVLKYLSRYTHRVAISHRRLIKLDTRAGTVRFIYKVRRKYGPPLWKSMDLSLEEFLRRYCLHILPERLVKIRHYGLRIAGQSGTAGRQERLARAKVLLEAAGIAPSQPLPSEANPPVEAPEPKAGGPAPPCAAPRWAVAPCWAPVFAGHGGCGKGFRACFCPNPSDTFHPRPRKDWKSHGAAKAASFNGSVSEMTATPSSDFADRFLRRHFGYIANMFGRNFEV